MWGALAERGRPTIVRMPRKQTTVEAVAAQVAGRAPVDEEKTVDPRTYLPTGSSMLNCVCSGDPRGAFPAGEMVNLIGDKSTGKTMVYFDMLASIATKRRFDDYRLIHRDVEHRLQFNLGHLFGQRLVDRLDEGDAPRTMDDMIADLAQLKKDGRPFIYGLDSFDTLSDAEDLKQMDKKSSKGDTDADGKKKKGSFGLAKVKGLGFLLRNIIADLEEMGSLLVIISQVRQNMDAKSSQKYYRTGGYSLGHHCSHEIWLSNGGKLHRTVRERKRQIGVHTIAKCTKNSTTGFIRECEFDIYPDYGLDDVGGCVDFLVDEVFWGTSKQSIVAGKLGTMSRVKLIKLLESDRTLFTDVRKQVGKGWTEIEESLRLKRQNKYE